jgi:transposase
VARELSDEIRRRTRTARDLEREIGTLVTARAPQLLDLTGCGILTAGKLIAETAGAERFASDAKFARPRATSTRRRESTWRRSRPRASRDVKRSAA